MPTPKNKNPKFSKITAYISMAAFLMWVSQMVLSAVLQMKLTSQSYFGLIFLIILMQGLFLLFFTINAKFSKYERKRLGLFKNRLWISAIIGFVIPIVQIGQQYAQANMSYYPLFWLLGLISLFMLYRHLPSLQRKQEV